VLHRLFAPVLPFVTEEVWSWWQDGSVHRSPWPDADEVRAVAGDGDAAVLDAVGRVLSELRKVKSENKVSMRSELASAHVAGPDAAGAALAADDLRAAGRITGPLTFDGAAPEAGGGSLPGGGAVTVVLPPPPTP